MNTATTSAASQYRERDTARQDRTKARRIARRDKMATVSRSFDPAALMRELNAGRIAQ